MPSRKRVGARQRPGQSICSREAFATFLGDLLSDSFLGFSADIGTINRCREQLLHAFEAYREAKSYDANYILQEMRDLHQVANDDIAKPANYILKSMSIPARTYRERIAAQYQATRTRTASLSTHARVKLIRRFRNRPEYLSTVAIESETLLPSTDQCDGAASLLPSVQRAYSELIASLSRIGMRYATHDDGSPKDGRRRPSGNRSRAPLIVEPFGPNPQPQPQKRGAERELEALLAVTWLELTGDASRKDMRYVAFVESFLKQVGSKGTDAAFLVNEARRQADRAKQKLEKPQF